MITRNAMQLKAIINKKATESNISKQLVLQNYMLERFLERISLSEYKDNFILKGGFLIAAMIGINTRTTMDMDMTIKGFFLSHESIEEIVKKICEIPVEDNIMFSVRQVKDIREADDYPGIRVKLMAEYPPLQVPLAIDITTGDKITPREVAYSFKLLFDDRFIPIMAYNLETVLAEKIETVLSRNIANTRPRDFYDIYILYSLRWTECDPKVLRSALIKTATKRGSIDTLPKYAEIIDTIKNDATMQSFWERYQKDFDYVSDIEFKDACETITTIMTQIHQSG